MVRRVRVDVHSRYNISKRLNPFQRSTNDEVCEDAFFFSPRMCTSKSLRIPLQIIRIIWSIMYKQTACLLKCSLHIKQFEKSERCEKKDSRI